MEETPEETIYEEKATITIGRKETPPVEGIHIRERLSFTSWELFLVLPVGCRSCLNHISYTGASLHKPDYLFFFQTIMLLLN